MDINDDDDSGSSNSGDSGADDTGPLCVSASQWADRLNRISLNKRIMDGIVMNYFVVEGHYDAAEAFQKESGIGTGEIVRSMGERVAIVSLIKAGKLAEAIDRLNELESEILDKNETLCFQLKSQQLIELIRSGDLQNALIFAQQNLAPRALNNAEFLKDVEDIMSLFVFDDLNKCPLSHLVSQAHRNHLANLVNVAVLERLGQDKDSKLLGLLRRLRWSGDRLGNLITFPTLQDVLSDPPANHSDSSCDRMEQDY